MAVLCVQMKQDDFLGEASFTVQDILNATSEEVALELALSGGLCKDKGDATVSLTARFTANSGEISCVWPMVHNRHDCCVAQCCSM